MPLDHLADSVLTSPLVARLRRAYPAATIDVLASPAITRYSRPTPV